MRDAVITIDPAVNHGAPCVRGVSVEAIAEAVWAGESVADVADDGDITPHQVLVACWYAGTYGATDWSGRRQIKVHGAVWRKRWAAWAFDVHPALWHSNPDRVPDPPTRAEVDRG